MFGTSKCSLAIESADRFLPVFTEKKGRLLLDLAETESVKWRRTQKLFHSHSVGPTPIR